jgi:hypothetical protein
VSPVTHSVANCVKRVVVIVSSVLFFRTPISPVNALGKQEQPEPLFYLTRLSLLQNLTALSSCRNWRCTRGSLPVLQAEENQTQESMMNSTSIGHSSSSQKIFCFFFFSHTGF